MEAMIIYLSSCVCLLLLSVVITFINKFWWTPICIQSKLRSQGIKGPSYKFIYGSTKEIFHMRNEIMATPMELSNHILPRIEPHVHSWIKLYGRNFLFWFGPKPQLIVTEPDLIKEILNDKEGGIYRKRDLTYFGKKLLGDGVVSARGEKWYKQRKIANHAFHTENLKNMIPAMIASVEMMLERWRHYEGKEVDVFKEFKVLTSEVISKTAFGSSYKEGEKIFDMLTKMALILTRNAFKVRIPALGKLVKTNDDIEADRLQKGINDSFTKMIKKRENNVSTEEDYRYGSDLLGLLVTACHHEDQTQRISIDDVIDDCKTFYVAGHETTASLLSWAVFLLATHSDWQDKARKEVLEVLGQANPTPNNISRLKTMSMIINETLRLYSPAVSILRETKSQVKLGSVIVPANVDITISVLALHHDPHIWGEDVFLFKPERFADGVAKATNNKMAAFCPFGLGPRTCVGLNFSMMETKVALSMLLQRYRFTLSPTYVHSPVQVISIRPQHGLPIVLHSL